MKLFGEIAIVVGGATGIGFEAACALYRAGAFVLIAGHDRLRGVEAVETLKEYGHGLQQCAFVSISPDDAPPLARIGKALGAADRPVDILVRAIDQGAEPGDEPLVQALLSAMIARRRGKIINLSASANRSGAPAQDFSQWAERDLVSPTRTLAAELARFDISVNCICIGSAAENGERDGLGRTGLPGAAPAQSVSAELETATLLFACAGGNHITGQALRMNC